MMHDVLCILCIMLGFPVASIVFCFSQYNTFRDSILWLMCNFFAVLWGGAMGFRGCTTKADKGISMSWSWTCWALVFGIIGILLGKRKLFLDHNRTILQHLMFILSYCWMDRIRVCFSFEYFCGACVLFLTPKTSFALEDDEPCDCRLIQNLLESLLAFLGC